MQQLGAHKSIVLPDTAILDFQPIGPGMGVQLMGTKAGSDEQVVLNAGGPGGVVDLVDTPEGMRWIAPLDARMAQATWKKLPQWMSAVAVRGSTGITHSRWDFIRVLANQEGGAHVDPSVEITYRDLRIDTLGVLSGPVEIPPGGGLPEKIDIEALQPPDSNVVEAAMRQIAHETIRALEKQFPSELS